MNKLILAAFASLYAAPVFAADPTMMIDQGGCNGLKFNMDEGSISLAAIMEMAPNLPPMPDGAFMMFYEPDNIGGNKFFAWSTDREGIKTYCEEIYFRQHRPVDGLWEFEASNVNIQGCPSQMDPTRGLTSQTRIEWSGIYGPESALEKYPMEFDWKKGDGINGLHFIATANAMPNVPGAVNITYEFKGISRTRINVFGTVDMHISAGGMDINCVGTLEMTGHPVQ